MSEAADISVVIPTRNGGAPFRAVLMAVLGQEAGGAFEVVAIDSGSTDGTAEFLHATARRDGRLRVLTIDPRDFGHGRTRNQAIQHARGQFVALVTQDACPANAQWLAALVAPMRADAGVAGVVGRQVAYPGAPLTECRQLVDHFERVRQWPAVMRLEEPRYDTDEPYRQMLHFFSDSNAALRRAVWEKIPYPDVPFGEDQLWAEAAVKAGFAKAYAYDAVVLHSHDYTLRQMYARQKEESAYYRRAFGYRLVPRLADVPRILRGHTHADRHFWLKTGRSAYGWRDLAWSVCLNTARLLGQYAGGRRGALHRSAPTPQDAL